MSKERELLMRWWKGARDQADLNELYDTTVKLLTQPEQAEQEPTTLSDKERQEAATEHRLKSMRGEK